MAAGEFISAAEVNALESPINRRLKLMFNPGAPVNGWPLTIAATAGQEVSSSPIATARSGLLSLLPIGSYFGSSAHSVKGRVKCAGPAIRHE